MKRIFSFVISFFVIFLLCGCDTFVSKTQIETSGKTNNSSQLSNNDNEFYLDSFLFENNSFKLVIDYCYCNKTNNYNLDICFGITNKEFSTKQFKIDDIELVKESTSATYSVSIINKIFDIEAELTKNIHLSSTIPSSIEDDKYTVSFEINSHKIILHLYETPDSLRVDRTVNFIVMDQIVNSVTVKDRRAIDSDYIYESTDHQYYCDEWHYDSIYGKQFIKTDIINDNVDLYGKQNSVVSIMTSSSDIYSYINGINRVPSDGIIIIQSKYLNKEICIGNFAIKDANIKEIYIPKTVHTIHSGNFKIKNVKIYYEGTEEEWKSLFYMQSDIILENVFFNTKFVEENK